MYVRYTDKQNTVPTLLVEYYCTKSANDDDKIIEKIHCEVKKLGSSPYVLNIV